MAGSAAPGNRGPDREDEGEHQASGLISGNRNYSDGRADLRGTANGLSMEAQITLETQELDEVTNEIRQRLLAFNQERAGPFHDVRVVLTARDAEGTLVGGLVGLGFWNGLFIELLWIDEPARRQGIGTALMQAAESEARE